MTTGSTTRMALAALVSLSLAACEGTGLLGQQSEPEAEGHKGPPVMTPAQAPVETGSSQPRAVATAEARTHNTAAFSARGNEPFWAVDVAGNTAIYKTPSNQRGQAVRVSRISFAEGVEYIGVLGGRPFVVNIRAADCTDSMSGQRFPMSATLTVSGRSETGCAGPATPEVAQAVAATTAPAPAAPRRATTPAATRPAASPAAGAATETQAETQAETPATQAPEAEAPDSGSTAPAGQDSPAIPAPVMRLPTTPPEITQPQDTTPPDAVEPEATEPEAPASPADPSPQPVPQPAPESGSGAATDPSAQSDDSAEQEE